MKQTVLPVVFGAFALAIISIAWTLPISGAPHKVPSGKEVVAQRSLDGEVLRAGDGWVIATNGQVSLPEALAD